MLGGGDPEAQGAAAASTAMMPVVNQWAQNVGSDLQQGLPSSYDPHRSFAQNALDPRGLEAALNVALGVGGGGGLATKALKAPPVVSEAAATPALSQIMQLLEGVKQGAPASDVVTRAAQNVVVDAATGRPRWVAPWETTRAGPFAESNLSAPYISKGTDAPMFDYSPQTLAQLPEQTHGVTQFDLPRYVPPKGVPARTLENIADPETKARVIQLADQGMKLGGPQWYNTMQLRDMYDYILGPKLGRERFGGLMDYTGTSTAGSRPPANLRQGTYYQYLDTHGDPLPPSELMGASQGGILLPSPYGSTKQNLHLQMADKYRSLPGFDTMQNPKPPSFSQNLQGNYTPLTIDEHMAAPEVFNITNTKGVPVGSPQPTEYGAYEKFGQDLARDVYKVPPAWLQAAIWIAKNAKDSRYADPFLKVFEDRARATAAQRGISPWQAITEMVKQERPFLSVGGAGLGLGGLGLGGVGYEPRDETLVPFR